MAIDLKHLLVGLGAIVAMGVVQEASATNNCWKHTKEKEVTTTPSESDSTGAVWLVDWTWDEANSKLKLEVDVDDGDTGNSETLSVISDTFVVEDQWTWDATCPIPPSDVIYRISATTSSSVTGYKHEAKDSTYAEFTGAITTTADKPVAAATGGGDGDGADGDKLHALTRRKLHQKSSNEENDATKRTGAALGGSIGVSLDKLIDIFTDGTDAGDLSDAIDGSLDGSFNWTLDVVGAAVNASEISTTTGITLQTVQIEDTTDFVAKQCTVIVQGDISGQANAVDGSYSGCFDIDCATEVRLTHLSFLVSPS